MTSSDRWNTQEKVERAIDEMLALNGGNLDQITAYAVAKHLGGNANSSLHDKVRAVKAKRQAALAINTEPLPVELTDGLAKAIDQFRDQVQAAVAQQYTVHARKLSDDAASRAAIDSRRLAEERANYEDLLALCQAAERERDEARAQISSLQARIARLTNENAELRGAKNALEQLTRSVDKSATENGEPPDPDLECLPVGQPWNDTPGQERR